MKKNNMLVCEYIKENIRKLKKKVPHANRAFHRHDLFLLLWQFPLTTAIQVQRSALVHERCDHYKVSIS